MFNLSFEFLKLNSLEENTFCKFYIKWHQKKNYFKKCWKILHSSYPRLTHPVGNIIEKLPNLIFVILLDEEDEDRIFDELEENVSIFTGIRYTYRGEVPKNLKWFDEILPQLDDKRFKMHIRCSRKQFNVILGQIENHAVFNGENCEKQFSVALQLALVLYRLGCNGTTLCKIASLFGVGDGGTIDKVTRRVFESIMTLKDKFLYWPSAEERDILTLKTFDELPHCVGYVDGMEVPLKYTPGTDHVSYFSKERQYSIKMQSVGMRFLFVHPPSNYRLSRECA